MSTCNATTHLTHRRSYLPGKGSNNAHDLLVRIVEDRMSRALNRVHAERLKVRLHLPNNDIPKHLAVFASIDHEQRQARLAERFQEHNAEMSSKMGGQ